jgi:hypothetical protein
MDKIIYWLTFYLLILFITSCLGNVKDDDETPLIFSGFADNTFSIRIFELKTDSKFKYWRNVHFNKFIVEGFWLSRNDTFYLINKVNENYGKIYFENKQPKFEINPNDSTLIDLANPGINLTYHNPPININFGVVR